jgi:hypothetical protein
MALRPIRRRAAPAPSLVQATEISTVHKDASNPRKSDPARMGLLKLSLKKLGFIQPLFITKEGMLLSGHQRTTTALEIDFKTVPTVTVELTEEQIRGVNLVFNRATNDFTAFDTGAKAAGRLDLEEVIKAAEALPDFEGEHWFALDCKSEPLAPLVAGQAERYDKKAANMALVPYRMGIKIPVVASASGSIVNGVHRAFAALEAGETHWPVIRIPDAHADVALNFLNYLSMDFHVDGDFEKLLRASAYRRPQNNRGAVPKAMRFWANGCRTLPDKDSYSTDYWRKFRDLHGHNVLDFGAGLGKAAPYLQTKGINAIDFEPYRIDPDSGEGVPSPAYSRQQAKRFLALIADPKLKLDSIFLCSVLNSVPFLRDRMCVLAIVHALSTRATVTYGTCRDISDYNYEYGGIRNANYFTFDSEPGVRLGDFMNNPKLQKFHTQDEARKMFGTFWKGVEFWPGGNVFYFKLTAPKGVNVKALGEALDFEFGAIPYKDGTTMGLAKEAREAFSKRLMTKV